MLFWHHGFSSKYPSTYSTQQFALSNCYIQHIWIVLYALVNPKHFALVNTPSDGETQVAGSMALISRAHTQFLCVFQVPLLPLCSPKGVLLCFISIVKWSLNIQTLWELIISLSSTCHTPQPSLPNSNHADFSLGELNISLSIFTYKLHLFSNLTYCWHKFVSSIQQKCFLST